MSSNTKIYRTRKARTQSLEPVGLNLFFDLASRLNSFESIGQALLAATSLSRLTVRYGEDDRRGTIRDYGVQLPERALVAKDVDEEHKVFLPSRFRNFSVYESDLRQRFRRRGRDLSQGANDHGFPYDEQAVQILTGEDFCDNCLDSFLLFLSIVDGLLVRVDRDVEGLAGMRLSDKRNLLQIYLSTLDIDTSYHLTESYSLFRKRFPSSVAVSREEIIRYLQENPYPHDVIVCSSNKLSGRNGLKANLGELGVKMLASEQMFLDLLLTIASLGSTLTLEGVLGERPDLN